MINLDQWRSLVRPGSIIGFSGRNLDSDIINIMTGGCPRWGLSHVGIMCPHPEYGMLLYEATTLNNAPCVIQKKMFSGAQAQYPDVKIFTYPGRVWLYNLHRQLRPYQVNRLSNFLNSMVGTPYDMVGALRSGGHLFNWLESRLHTENLHRIFCSEMTAAAYRDLGIFGTKNVSRWNPNKFVRACNDRCLLTQPLRII